MINIFVDTPTTRLGYVIQLLFESILGIEYHITNDPNEYANTEGLKINYSSNIELEGLYLKPYGLLAEQDIREHYIETKYWGYVPTFFHVENSFIPFDIFSASFYLATCYEEYHSKNKNIETTLTYEVNLYNRPIINKWAWKLASILEFELPTLEIKRPSINLINLIRVNSSKKEKNINPLTTRLTNSNLHQKDQKVLLKTDHKTILFKRTDYVPQSLNIECEKLEDGIYLDNSYLNNSKLTDPKQKVYFYQKGLIIPTVYESLIKMGVMHDFSFGYSFTGGFRACLASPFYFFNLKSNKTTELVVHPLIINDQSFLNKEYDNTINELKSLIAEISVVGGTFTSLFHGKNLLGNTNKSIDIFNFIQRYVDNLSGKIADEKISNLSDYKIRKLEMQNNIKDLIIEKYKNITQKIEKFESKYARIDAIFEKNEEFTSSQILIHKQVDAINNDLNKLRPVLSELYNNKRLISEKNIFLKAIKKSKNYNKQLPPIISPEEIQKHYLNQSNCFFTLPIIKKVITKLKQPAFGLSGASGTGKTTMATNINLFFGLNKEDCYIETFDVKELSLSINLFGQILNVGGIKYPQLGKFFNSLIRCIIDEKPTFLIINELQDADIGELFSDIAEYLSNNDNRTLTHEFIDLVQLDKLYIPDNFKIIGTLNQKEGLGGFYFPSKFSRRFPRVMFNKFNLNEEISFINSEYEQLFVSANANQINQIKRFLNFYKDIRKFEIEKTLEDSLFQPMFNFGLMRRIHNDIKEDLEMNYNIGDMQEIIMQFLPTPENNSYNEIYLNHFRKAGYKLLNFRSHDSFF